MKHTASISSNETVEILTVHGASPYKEGFVASIFIYGDFDNGSISIQASSDGGTTKIALRDSAGTAITVTDDDIRNVILAVGRKMGEEIKLYAVMTGATSPDVTIDAFDNR